MTPHTKKNLERKIHFEVKHIIESVCQLVKIIKCPILNPWKIYTLVFFFVCLLRQGSLCSPGCPETHRDLPASARIKGCIIIPVSSVLLLKLNVYLGVCYCCYCLSPLDVSEMGVSLFSPGRP